MDEAKNRGSEADRIANAKTQLLGDNPFNVAYEVIFGMVTSVYGQTGGVNHELIGLDFKDGKVSGINVFLIEDEASVARIPMNVERMLLKWPLVAHVTEAWAAPPDGIEPSDHPERKDIIAILIHSQDAAMTASCEVDETLRTVNKAVLRQVEKIGGRLGRNFETRH